jgi:hypothetical protein
LTEIIQLRERLRDQEIANHGENDRWTLNGLADAYRAAGRLPEAIQLYEQVRDMLIAKLGPDHPDTLSSMSSLSHAPRMQQTAMMLIDAFEPEGFTALAKDSIFMMPQLGVLSTVHPKAAKEVFEKDCLIRLGSTVAPVGPGKEGVTALRASLEYPDGRRETLSIPFGYLRLVPVPEGQSVKAVLNPERGLDVGAGKGREREVVLKGGVVGVIFDCRGRQPFALPADRDRLVRLEIHSLRQPVHHVPDSLPVHLYQQVARPHP